MIAAETKIKWGKHFLTDEQENALRLARTGKSLKIEAYAGSGKTTLLNAIATLGLQNKKILYCAFNKAIVSEAERVFPRNVSCMTSHKMAGRQTVAWKGKGESDGKFDGRRISSVNASYVLNEFQISETFEPEILKKLECGFDSYDIASLALSTIDKFCTTADAQLAHHHCYNDNIKDLIAKAEMAESNCEEDKKFAICAAIREVKLVALEWASKIWQRMSDTDDNIRITHNVYLKAWALSNPALSEYDCILVDEAQDVNALLLDVVSKQTHAQIIYVGDSYQSIYSWNGAIDALTKMRTDNAALISQSFRFGSKIASLASAILSTAYNKKIEVKGFDPIDSKIVKLEKYDAFIARTNACLIKEMTNFIQKNKGVTVAIQGGMGELVGLLKDAKKLMNDQRVKRGELAGHDNWESVVKHSETTAGGGIKVLVGLCQTYNIESLIELLESADTTNDVDDADVVFTTAHKSKGLEFNSVKLADDFREIKCGMNKEEANLLYVACTRAIHELDVFDCTSITENEKFKHLFA